jgi:hypothetical protein
MRKLVTAFIGPAALAIALTAPALANNGSGGVSDGAAFYANGNAYRTVGTPTDFSGTGAPDHAFDIIYAFPEGTQINVAEAAPGDRDFNGGRWMVTPISFDDYASAAAAYGGANGVFDSDAEVLAAVAAGAAELGDPVRYFECPVIKMPRGHSQ